MSIIYLELFFPIFYNLKTNQKRKTLLLNHLQKFLEIFPKVKAKMWPFGFFSHEVRKKSAWGVRECKKPLLHYLRMPDSRGAEPCYPSHVAMGGPAVHRCPLKPFSTRVAHTGRRLQCRGAEAPKIYLATTLTESILTRDWLYRPHWQDQSSRAIDPSKERIGAEGEDGKEGKNWKE